MAKNSSFIKGLKMLDVLAQSEQSRGVTELAAFMGLTKSNVHRLLSALQQEGYVRRDSAGSGYELTLKVWELGSLVMSRLDLQRVARPYLADLGRRTGEAAHLAVLERTEVIYVDKIESPQPVRAYSRIGGRAPARLVATGKALLAFTRPCPSDEGVVRPDTPNYPPMLNCDERDRIRKQGFSVNRGEWRADVGGVAAPVFDASGKVVAAIGMSGPMIRLPEDRLDAIAADVVAVAAGASKALGYKGSQN